VGAVDRPLQAQLDQPVEVPLDPDHLQAVVEGLRRIAVGDPAGQLVEAQEAEPDRELEAEVRPTTWQDPAAG
jgi:hypothetical protein